MSSETLWPSFVLEHNRSQRAFICSADWQITGADFSRQCGLSLRDILTNFRLDPCVNARIPNVCHRYDSLPFFGMSREHKGITLSDFFTHKGVSFLLESVVLCGHYHSRVEGIYFENFNCHPREFSKQPHVLFTNHPDLVSKYSAADVYVVAESGHIACLRDHPEFATWKDRLSSGEMWQMFGERWVTTLCENKTCSNK